MAAYVVANITVTDQEGYDEYRRRVPGVIEQYGGKYLARGGKVEHLEGDVTPNRMVITVWESFEAALRWYNSPEYTELRAIREKASTGDLYLLEGLPE
jgi:uncharacterized protein (DUF1330 family)